MNYMPIDNFIELRNYTAKYMPHWLIPLDLTFRSMLRIFETGLVREKDIKTGRAKKRVVPTRIQRIDDNTCMISFRGKFGVPREVEVPYSKEDMQKWYNETAKHLKKESYKQWLITKTKKMFEDGYNTHDGRNTSIINFLILYGKDMTGQIEILSRTGHGSLNEIMPYIRRYVAAKRLVGEKQKKKIRSIMKHIKV